MIEATPGDAVALAHRGRAHRLRGRWRARLGETHAAIADLEHSTDLHLRNASAQFELGALFALIGDPEQAIERSQRALELEPDEHPEARAAIEALTRRPPA